MAMKRANGSGTVYKMKHKQLRKLRKRKLTQPLPSTLPIHRKKSSVKLRLANVLNGGLRKQNARGCLLVE